MRKKFNGRIGGNGAVGRGGDKLAEIFGTTVAGGKETGEIGRARIVSDDKTRLVKKQEAAQITVLKNFSEGRETTNFDEETGNGKDLLVF